jgi:DNA polymerase-3 subunit alpha
MPIWTPLHLHTHYSLLDGLSKPSQVAERCEQLGYDACAVTDHGTISGAVSFVRAMNAKNIKPILGCEFYLCGQDPCIKDKTNRKLSHLVVLAKNFKGWRKLIEATSASNDEEVFYHKPRLDLDTLAEYCDGNLISFSGHLGSQLADIIFSDAKSAYGSTTYEEAKSFIDPDWIVKTTQLAEKYSEIFGRGNFFLEIQLIDQDMSPAQKITAEGLRYISKKTGIPCVATADSHYASCEDASDQRVLLCSAVRTTLRKVQSKLDNAEDVGLGSFFRSDKYHIPTEEEIQEINTEAEIHNTKLISDMCETYDILDKPMLPKFTCPDGMSEEGYLRHLCRDGWKDKLVSQNKILDPSRSELYADRVKEELSVIQKANLSGYFLIVRDIVDHVKAKNWLPGPGRGSAAGCLVSYLVGITKVDPIEYGLMFERFYNAGRNTDGHISLPDIDIDVPASKREGVIEYMRQKYGRENVGQMVTFGRMQGRTALKEVLRVHDACSFDEMNQITKNIPSEAEISDQLQEMTNPSIIRWALKYQPDQLKDWCRLEEDGSFSGELGKLFEQAVRLEGTYKSQGKHAAGVVISSENLSEVCPMVREKRGSEKIAGLEMEDLESMGHVKFDILGISFLDKIIGISNQLSTGSIS